MTLTARQRAGACAVLAGLLLAVQTIAAGLLSWAAYTQPRSSVTAAFTVTTCSAAAGIIVLGLVLAGLTHLSTTGNLDRTRRLITAADRAARTRFGGVVVTAVTVQAGADPAAPGPNPAPLLVVAVLDAVAGIAVARLAQRLRTPTAAQQAPTQ
ncbi:hypothetical protein ACQPZJ_44775 [Actinoplanes sp. CA-054009]